MKSRNLIIPSLLLITAACNSKDESNDTSLRDNLYKDVCHITRLYADSMAHVSDSASVMTLTEHFEARLQSINMKYPPGTDKLLTEDLNDTIYMLTRKFIDARAKALAPVDTLTQVTDSING